MFKSCSISAIMLVVSLLCGSLYAEVREPVVAGTFYPGDSSQLAGVVEQHLDNVNNLPEIDGRIFALIVPHAGLVYSGQIAAYSYKLLENSGIDKVIICCPSHRYGFQGLSVYGPDIDWKTPLGTVGCNKNLCQKLLGFDRQIDVVPEAHAQEHSLEVQLPYLQTVLETFEIVPIAMGYPNHSTIELLANSLAKLDMDSRTVMVASTDWQHYRPASEGWKMDSLGMRCLESLDPSRLEHYLESGEVEMCGGGSAVAVMKAAIAQGANRVKLLKYGDSGDLTGDKKSVVGYVAAVIYKSGTKPSSSSESNKSIKAQEESAPESGMLTNSEKTQLLQIARKSIKQYLTDGSLPEFEVSGLLAKPGAAFVTLEKNDMLRGCIGHTLATDPLYKTVSICAVQAAVSDRRFLPVKANELDSLHIEISWLTPLKRVKSLNEIEVGRDGLMITLGNNRGLLLPQVATEYSWSRDEFLENTCRKAGLPTDAYKSPNAIIETFRAVVFGED